MSTPTVASLQESLKDAKAELARGEATRKYQAEELKRLMTENQALSDALKAAPAVEAPSIDTPIVPAEGEDAVTVRGLLAKVAKCERAIEGQLAIIEELQKEGGEIEFTYNVDARGRPGTIATYEGLPDEFVFIQQFSFRQDNGYSNSIIQDRMLAAVKEATADSRLGFRPSSGAPTLNNYVEELTCTNLPPFSKESALRLTIELVDCPLPDAEPVPAATSAPA